MYKKENLLKELHASKALLYSTFSAEEKNEAFRKQTLILDEIARTASEIDALTDFRAQLRLQNFTGDNSYKSYIQQRIENAQRLSNGTPRRSSTTTLSAEVYLRASKCSLETKCSGNYRSCLKHEVSADDLKVFKDILGEVPSAGLLLPPAQKKPFSVGSRAERECVPTRQSMINIVKGTPVQCAPTNMPNFRTAREQLIIQNSKTNSNPGSPPYPHTSSLFNYGASKKSLGTRRNVHAGFVPPIRPEENALPTYTPPVNIDLPTTEPVDERLKNIDPKMVTLITNEIMHKYKPIGWNDIAGLEYAKATIKEAVVWPLLRPDIFTGLRRPPRGILLFGPPGTGKTLIGKCIASQSKATFFSISASSLTSKWVGDGEKMVRALFAVAAVHQPSVVFIDEIDSLLSQRSNTEHESSRRIKTEFLVQLDGATTTGDERILIVGATNRPQEIDEAARRRLVRRLYIPLPELPARIQILTNLLQTVRNDIKEEGISDIGNLTNGYSGADMETLCREASMEPIRSIPPDEIPFFNEENVRAVTLNDFISALERVRASVSQADLQQYADWNKMYGAGQ